MKLDRKEILSALETITIAGEGKNMVESGAVQNVITFGDEVVVDLLLSTPAMHIKKRAKDDIKKLFTAFSISEAIFILSKTYIHYSLLASSFEPYQAYTFAEFISWIIYLISINVGTKAIKLFEN